MKIPAHAKYQIIYDTMQKNDNLLNVAAMCEIAGVSRSGYYHYLSTEDQRMEREERDRQDFLLILKAYQYRGYHKGARSIYMRLLHMEPPIAVSYTHLVFEVYAVYEQLLCNRKINQFHDNRWYFPGRRRYKIWFKV